MRNAQRIEFSKLEKIRGRGRCSMGGRGRMPTFLRSETNGCDPSGLQMKSRGSISGGIGWICFNASLKKIERTRVIYIRV